jgi:ferredoxin-NADP reductase
MTKHIFRTVFVGWSLIASVSGAVPTQYKTTKVAGLNIAYREAGDPGSPKLVLLHGFPASSHQYRDLIPALATRFHVIAPDYPGFGNSDMPDPAMYAYTVKQQGTVSSFLNRGAMAGLKVEAHGPFGQFYFDESQHRDIVLFAGGSGITPMMAMLRYIEETAADTRITMFYAVRTETDVIFREELDRLRKRLPRFRCTVVASSPGTDWTGPRGHVNRALIEAELGEIGKQTFFLCGPAGFMASAREILMSLGVRAEQIRQERFTIGTPDPARAAAASYPVEFARSGGKYECSSADSLLTCAESHGIDIPSSCRVGQCGTCATQVLDGEVEMETEEGLDPALRARGYRLMCVGRVRSPVRLDA